VRGRKELPPVENVTYAVAVDPAFKRNDFALAVLHRQGDGAIVVDWLATWTGKKSAPLGYEWVCEEIARIVKAYGIITPSTKYVTGFFNLQRIAPAVRGSTS
jgi:hypothetical protein